MVIALCVVMLSIKCIQKLVSFTKPLLYSFNRMVREFCIDNGHGTIVEKIKEVSATSSLISYQLNV